MGCILWRWNDIRSAGMVCNSKSSTFMNIYNSIQRERDGGKGHEGGGGGNEPGFINNHTSSCFCFLPLSHSVFAGHTALLMAWDLVPFKTQPLPMFRLQLAPSFFATRWAFSLKPIPFSDGEGAGSSLTKCLRHALGNAIRGERESGKYGLG